MALPVAGQTAAYRAPRLADGHPDLNGIWQAINEANYDIELHAARPAHGPARRPVRAAARRAGPGAGRGRRRAAGYRRRRRGDSVPARGARTEEEEPGELADAAIPRSSAICLACRAPPTCRTRFRSSRARTAVFIAYQYAGAVRNIYLKDPGPAPVDSWMGQSVGRWEGDTLVVDVTGFNDQTWFDRSGNFHSDALHVVERYTRTAPTSSRTRRRSRIRRSSRGRGR